MKYDKFKLFWKVDDSKKNVEIEYWDEQAKDYYSLIKEQMEKGYHQISITAELMLGYISQISEDEKINIEKIELMEDESDENRELNELVELCRSNRGMLVKILEKLHYLEDESSIEIKRVYFTEKTGERKYESFFIQVNGVLGSSNIEIASIKKLKEYVKETINE